MRLNTGDNCHAHNLPFANDKVVITREAEDVNYKGRKLEEYEK
jgi:hypothetical protein